MKIVRGTGIKVNGILFDTLETKHSGGTGSKIEARVSSVTL